MTLEKCERLPSHFFPRGVCPREQFFLAQIVICVGNGEKVRLASSGFEGLGKVLGLLKGHGFVQGAMNNLEWWDTWTYIGDGEALRMSSSRSEIVPPKSCVTGEGASLIISPPVLKKSYGAERVTTACTRLEYPDEPQLPSRLGRSAVTPSKAASCPPAESPQAPMRSGLIWYSFAWARSQRTAAFASWIWAGKRAQRL